MSEDRWNVADLEGAQVWARPVRDGSGAPRAYRAEISYVVPHGVLSCGHEHRSRRAALACGYRELARMAMSAADEARS